MLGLLVPLGEGESPVSFCSRLARRNGCESVRDFCLDMGLRFQDVVDGNADALASLADLGGVDGARLSRHALRKLDHERYLLGDQLIARPMLRRSLVRVCPACLADDLARWPRPGLAAAYQRTEWLLSPLCTCPAHGVSLVSVAHNNYAMEAHDFSVLVSTPLAQLDDWREQAVKRAPSRLENYLRERLTGIVRTATAWLNALPFYAAAKLCEVIGAVQLHGPKVAISAQDEEQQWMAGDVGFEIAADGPNGIRRLLDRLTQPF